MQLVSLAGLHSNAVGFGVFIPYFIPVFTSSTPNLTAELAQRFKSDGMLAYVETVQRKEKEIGCDVLTHQKWCALFCVIPCHRQLRFSMYCFVGAEQTMSIGSCPHLHPDHRAPLQGEMILPNIHSNQMS